MIVSNGNSLENTALCLILDNKDESPRDIDTNNLKTIRQCTLGHIVKKRSFPLSIVVKVKLEVVECFLLAIMLKG